MPMRRHTPLPMGASLREQTQCPSPMRSAVHRHRAISQQDKRTRFSERRAIFTAKRNLHNPIHGKALMRGTYHGVAAVMFKNRRVLVGWCLRRSTQDAEVARGLRSQLRSYLLSHSSGPGEHLFRRIVLLTQPAVVVHLFISLSASTDGDSLLFLCEGPHVVRWLESALHMDGTCPSDPPSRPEPTTAGAE